MFVDHFYTSTPEKEKILGYSQEGIPFFAFNSQVSGSIPVYRYFNHINHDHFYTTNEFGELALQANYTYEMIAFYVFEKQEEGSVPLYRYFDQNTGNHFYTLDQTEVNVLENYKYEGILGFVFREHKTDSIPVYRFYLNFQEPQNNVDFSSKYSDESFWKKVGEIILKAGRNIIEQALILFYTFKDPKTPDWAKNIIIGALGYFIWPFDIIPDFLPFGYTDDYAVLVLAISTVISHITEEHKHKANEKLIELFK